MSRASGGIRAGSTNVIWYFDLRNGGTPVTGLSPVDLVVNYWRPGAAPVTLPTPSALSAHTDAHTDNGMLEVDATNMAGIYRYDLPDAVFAAGVDYVIIYREGFGVPGQAERINLESGVNVELISGDAAAADNLEAVLDGTGGVDLAMRSVAVTASGNQNAVTLAGAGSGHGLVSTGGATGDGLRAVGGATSGSGLHGVGGGTATVGIHGTPGSGGAFGLAVGAISGSLVGDITGSVGGNVDGSVGEVLGGVGGNVAGQVASVAGDVGGNVVGNVGGSVASVVGDVGGNLNGNVVGNVQGSVTGAATLAAGAISTSTFADGAINALALGDDAVAKIKAAGSSVTDVNGSAVAATNLGLMFGGGVVRGAVQSGLTPTLTAFRTDLTESTEDMFVGSALTFVSGTNSGRTCRIINYDATNKVVTLADGDLFDAPAIADAFLIGGRFAG